MGCGRVLGQEPDRSSEALRSGIHHRSRHVSSAATLAVALRCAKKSSVLRKDMVNFGIPLFANIHLCGSVLTEVFFVMTISRRFCTARFRLSEP